MNKKLGFIALLLAAACFGSFGIWIRLLSRELDIYQQIVLRNLVAMIIASIIVIVGKKYILDWKKIPKRNLILYGLAVPISVIFYNIAIINQKVAVTTFIFYIGSILISYFISLMIFREKINAIKIISLILVFIGLSCFVYPFTAKAVSFGLIAGFIGGLLDGSANGFRKNLGGQIDKFFLIFITAIGGILVSGSMLIRSGTPISSLSNVTPTTWFIGIIFGLILILANYLLLIGFQNYDLGLGTIVLSSELFFALVFGLLFFQEIPSSLELLGGLCILLAIILPNLKFSQKLPSLN